MVLVNTVSNFLLVDARAGLERLLESRPQSDIALVFGSWMAPLPENISEAKAIAAAAAQRSGAQQDFQTVAMLGYALHAGLLDTIFKESLKRGLERLAGRQPFVDEVPMPFCSDSIGLLGVAIGTRDLLNRRYRLGLSRGLMGFLGRFTRWTERKTGNGVSFLPPIICSTKRSVYQQTRTTTPRMFSLLLESGEFFPRRMVS